MADNSLMYGIAEGAKGFLGGYQAAQDIRQKQIESQARFAAIEEERRRNRIATAIDAGTHGLLIDYDKGLVQPDMNSPYRRQQEAQAKYYEMLAAQGKPPSGYTVGPHGELIPLPDTEASIAAKQQGLLTEQQRLDLDRQRLALDERYKNALINKANQRPAAPKGKVLPPATLMAVQDGRQIPNMLGELRQEIQSQRHLFDPIKGTLSSLNPYNENVQTLNAKLTATAQVVGKYLEGGVLRQEDVPKYRKMLPNIGDTPAVAEQKLNYVQNLVDQKTRSYVEAFQASGYDTTAFSSLLGGGGGAGPSAGGTKSGGAPPVGTVRMFNGVPYEFKGGNHREKANWVKKGK